jgi:hypothetical protein
MNLHQIQILYTHHLSLYHKRRWTEQSGLFNLELCQLYGQKLIKEGILSKEQHEMNKLPQVDLNALFKPIRDVVVGDDSNSGIDGE